jgi:hypothetical protein
VDPQTMTIACLFLAGKVEEHPIHSHRLVNYIVRAKTQLDHELADDAPDFRLGKALLLSYEELLLETMGFDMLVVNPCAILDAYRSLFADGPAKLHVIQLALDFIVDR